MEIWKDVIGYEGVYKVSNLGRIKSVSRIDSLGRKRKEKIMKGSFDKDGYIISTFRHLGTKKIIKFHRLVATAFIANIENKPYVNHINGIKNDNRACNLEWCTAKENSVHAVKMGLNNPTKGEKCSFYGLKGELNINSKKILNTKTNQTFNSIREASDFYNIKYNILSKNLNGQNINKTDLVYFNSL